MAQVVERRLPAIYDALDSRNNKVGVNLLAFTCSPAQAGISCKSTPKRWFPLQLALKLINSALQKQSKSQMLRALKAIALQRTGKDEEGLQVRLLAQTSCLLYAAPHALPLLYFVSAAFASRSCVRRFVVKSRRMSSFLAQ